MYSAPEDPDASYQSTHREGRDLTERVLHQAVVEVDGKGKRPTNDSRSEAMLTTSSGTPNCCVLMRAQANSRSKLS
jgi:hypothetical protein